MSDDREHTSDPVDVRVLAELRAAGGPCTAEALAEKLGFTLNTTKRGIGKLVRDHVVRKAGGGLYTIATRPTRRRAGADTAGAGGPTVPPEPAPRVPEPAPAMTPPAEGSPPDAR